MCSRAKAKGKGVTGKMSGTFSRALSGRMGDDGWDKRDGAAGAHPRLRGPEAAPCPGHRPGPGPDRHVEPRLQPWAWSSGSTAAPQAECAGMPRRGRETCRSPSKSAANQPLPARRCLPAHPKPRLQARSRPITPVNRCPISPVQMEVSNSEVPTRSAGSTCRARFLMWHPARTQGKRRLPITGSGKWALSHRRGGCDRGGLGLRAGRDKAPPGGWQIGAPRRAGPVSDNDARDRAARRRIAAPAPAPPA